MVKVLRCFAVCLLAAALNTTVEAADLERAADEASIANHSVGKERTPSRRSSTSAYAILERMPDEELITMARRIYQSKLATAEMFNLPPPVEGEHFANRREVIDYIKAALAEKNMYGHQ